MPIQFRCSQCGQPIEVDNEHAGRVAVCPYCQHSISVPAESTYRADEAVAARPAGAETPPAPLLPPLPGSPGVPPPAAPDPRAQAARTYGNYGLVCVVLAVGLFITAMVGLFGVMAPFMTGPNATTQPAELVKLAAPGLQARPWIMGAYVGAFFFGLVGLALGVVSVTQRVAGNFRGWIATLCCGAFLLCNCSLYAIAAVQQAGKMAEP